MEDDLGLAGKLESNKSLLELAPGRTVRTEGSNREELGSGEELPAAGIYAMGRTAVESAALRDVSSHVLRFNSNDASDGQDDTYATSAPKCGDGLLAYSNTGHPSGIPGSRRDSHKGEAAKAPVISENEGMCMGEVDEAFVEALLQKENFKELVGSSGKSFADYLALEDSADRERNVMIKAHRLLRHWLTTELNAGQREELRRRVANPPVVGSLKRGRDDSAGPGSINPVKSARTSVSDVKIINGNSHLSSPVRRLRYSIAELLTLRHDGKNGLLNRYSFSKGCESPDAVVVSRADELAVGADGRLRSTDVLLPNADEATPATFESMLLPDAVVEGLRKAGFTAPSPVQYRGIPVGRIGADVVAQAKSGTGKTVVFAALIAEIALGAPAGQIVALVLTPTREIARQVRQVVSDVLPCGASTGKGKDVALLVGGSPVRRDVEALRGARVAVGTPGRVRALLERGNFDGAHVRMLVLDEADRLLDPSAGFALGALAGCLAEQRQTLAFSATYTPKLVARLRKIMRTPQLVWLGDECAAGGEDGAMHRAAVLRAVSQFRVDVGGYGVKAKAEVFVQVLSMYEFSGCIAFAAQRDAVAHYAKQARKAGFAAKHVSAALNGKERKAVVEEFEQGNINVLVCTDLMARGVSFEMCDFVVQLDVALNTQTHLHRVGRAGRFGTTGVGVVVVEESQRGDIREIERDIGALPEWPCAREIASKCGLKTQRDAKTKGPVPSNDSAQPRRNALAEVHAESQKDARALDKARSQGVISQESTAGETSGDGDSVMTGAERATAVAQIVLKGLEDSVKIEGRSAGDGITKERERPVRAMSCSADMTDEPEGKGGQQPQTAELSDESMSLARGTAWAAGFAQGYQRAWKLIRQLSDHQ